MQAPTRPRLPLPTAGHAATPLLRPARRGGPSGLPLFPPAWQRVPMSNRLRHDDGREIHLLALDSTVDLPRVARVTLGAHRLSVHSAGDRCEARWTAAGTAHRLRVEAVSLAGFMDLLLSLIWD